MPLYEYICRSCAGRFERMRRMEERLQAPECPTCGAKETVLAMSAPGHVGAGAGAGAPRGGGCADGACEMGGGGCCGGQCMH